MLFCTIRPKNTNLVEDVTMLLPVKFRQIPFSGFREEVENVSQRLGRLSFLRLTLGRGHWYVASSQVSLNSLQRFREEKSIMWKVNDGRRTTYYAFGSGALKSEIFKMKIYVPSGIWSSNLHNLYRKSLQMAVEGLRLWPFDFSRFLDSTVNVDAFNYFSSHGNEIIWVLDPSKFVNYNTVKTEWIFSLLIFLTWFKHQILINIQSRIWK